MNRIFPKILILFATGVLTGSGIVTVMIIQAELTDPLVASAAPAQRALATPAATREPTPTPDPAPPVTPAPTPAVLGATVATPLVAAAVKPPPLRKDVPLLCQSQSYSPEREAKCPRAGAAPARKVTLTALNNAATTPATLPAVVSAKPLPAVTPFPSLTPAPPAAPPAAAATPAPTTAPPTPTSTPTPANAACGGGYPALLCQATIDSLVDPWGMYNRECTSYAAYKVSASGRKMPYWGGRGNAKQWPDNARAARIPVDSVPRVGDVAVSLAGTWGHVMYVEAVSETRVRVSQYNYSTPAGTYSEMIVPIAGLLFIHFP